MVKKVKSQMKAPFFNLKEPIFIIGFLTTFKLACNTDNIRDGAAMRLVPHYVNETLANELNSRMCATDKSSPITSSVRNVENWSHNLLGSYSEVVNYLLKRFATDQAIVYLDAAMLQYM